MLDLDTLATLHGTDKGPGGHEYTKRYNELFAHLENEEFTLLEIGIWRGASLKMWHDAFPKALIVGVDIMLRPMYDAPERITCLPGDARNPVDMISIAQKYKPTVVVDDGSHATMDQLVSLLSILPHMPKGGIYVIEDLAPQESPTYWLLANNTALKEQLGLESVEMTDALAILRK